MTIEELIARRADLSTFLVHLTREYGGRAAAENLRSIIQSGQLEARNPMGMAVQALRRRNHPDLPSQSVVCFTETPLSHLNLLLGPIDARDNQFSPYGIALPKMRARRDGVNPIWYLDMTPGHDWLTVPFGELVESALNSGQAFAQTPISKLAPFVEQMGRWEGRRKEFWWEREWRYAGNYAIPRRFIGLCPEAEINDFERFTQENLRRARFIDPRWSLERMIGHLAGFEPDDLQLI